jgi:DNA-binding Lrp family transcriptional regulator
MLNEKDLIILNELRKDSKISSRSLAKRVGLPISTVYRRVKNMEEKGIITGYHASVDFEKIGKPVGVLILINLAEGKEFIPIDEIRNHLQKSGEIMDLMTLHGGSFDLMAKVRLSDLDSITPFLEKIRNIEGIEEVSCTIISQELE